MHVEVEEPAGASLGPYRFFVWKGLRIVASGYHFKTAVEAANAGNKALAELREAKRIIRSQQFPYRLFHKRSA